MANRLTNGGLVALTSLALASSASLRAQAPLVVQGQVLAEADGQPLPHARISVAAPPSPQSSGPQESPVMQALMPPTENRASGMSVLSDERGRFQLTVPATAATLRLTTTKAGYATRVTRVQKQTLADTLTVRLPRGAAVSGRVVDRQGHVATTALVAARAMPVEGATVDVTPPLTLLAETNDLGEYRIGGLPPGRYSITVVGGPTPAVGRLDGLATALANGADPDSTMAKATSAPVSVVLQAGDDVGGLELVTQGSSQVPGFCAAATPASGDGTGVIAGRVVDQRGQPVLCANVRLLTTSTNPVVATDAAGHFEFTGLPSGTYGLEARKAGHITSRFDPQAVGPPRTRITLAEGRALSNIELVLPSASAITGTIVDSAGEPVAGVLVRAMQPRAMGDLRLISTAPGVRPQRTDDRGRFRLFGVLPGSYYIATSTDVANGPTPAGEEFLPLLYPNATSVTAASLVTVEASRDVVGIDMTLNSVRGARVTGLAFDANGQPARRVLLGGSHQSNSILLEPRVTTAGAGGAFAFANVPPGQYVVQVLADSGGPAMGPPQPFHFGMAFVPVADADPLPVTVRARPGSVVEGRVVSADGTRAGVRMMTVPTDFDRSPMIGQGLTGSTFSADGTFRLEGITGPRRLAKAGGPDDWYVRSALVNGRDALDTPFDFGLAGETFRDVEVVVANDSATVTGRVADARQTVEQYAVRVFSTDRRHWFPASQWLKSAQTGPLGEFRVAGIPPGEYFVVAVEASDSPLANVDWQDSVGLEALARRAERVTLGPAETRPMTLPLRP